MENTSQTLEIEIQMLNMAKMRLNIPAIVFVSVMMVCGIIGNTLVCYIYAAKYKPSNYRIFILWLAAIDNMACVICMPFHIAMMSLPVMFYNSNACRGLQVISYSVVLSSLSILLIISIERYRKICHPFSRQISIDKANHICVMGVVLPVIIFSWPAGILYGHSTVVTHSVNITGVQCFIDDYYMKTKFPVVFNGAVTLYVIICISVLSLLYGIIAKRIVVYKRSRKQSLCSSSIENNIENDSPTGIPSDVINDQSPPSEVFANTVRVSSSTSMGDNSSCIETQIDISKASVYTMQQKIRQFDILTLKTTLVFLTITVMAVVGALPHLGLMITAAVNKTFLPSLSPTGMALFQFFRRSFFINNFVNPFICGFGDSKFRFESKALFKKLMSRK